MNGVEVGSWDLQYKGYGLHDISSEWDITRDNLNIRLRNRPFVDIQILYNKKACSMPRHLQTLPKSYSDQRKKDTLERPIQQDWG